jgi:hypothetical protein
MPDTLPDDLASLFGQGDDAAPSGSLTDAARAYLMARAIRDTAEDVLKERNEALRKAEGTLLGLMDEQGVKSLKLDVDGKPVALTASTTVRYALPPDALENSAFFLWLLRNGGQDLVKRTVHWATFSSFCKELAEAGKTVHPTVRQTTQRTVSRR